MYVYFPVFDDVLKGFNHLLNIFFWLLCNIKLANEFPFLYFHSLNLILVVKVHDLPRIFDLFEKLLCNFILILIDVA